MSLSHKSLPLTVALAMALPCATAAAASLVMPPDQTQPTTPTTPGNTTTRPNAPNDQITDAEIVMVLETISDTGTENSRKANKSTKDRRVKKFTDMRAKHATAAKKRQEKLRNRHKMKSQRGDAQNTYETTVIEAYKDLDGMTAGRDYDIAYMEDEIQTLTNTLDTIDKVLLPYVDLPELRTELTTVRTQVEKDLKEAQKVLAALRELPTT